MPAEAATPGGAAISVNFIRIPFQFGCMEGWLSFNADCSWQSSVVRRLSFGQVSCESEDKVVDPKAVDTTTPVNFICFALLPVAA